MKYKTLILVKYVLRFFSDFFVVLETFSSADTGKIHIAKKNDRATLRSRDTN